MVNAYFISGLGADERVFRHIELPAGFRPIYLNWMKPEQDESLIHYAGRMAERIDRSAPFVLIGLSMGGMVATEIARQMPPRSLVLISSIPLASHLPAYFRAAGKARLHRLVPIRLILQASWIKRFFTTELAEDREILRQMIRACDPAFIRWAVQAVLNWKNNQMPVRFFQIHGTHDWILPVKYTQPTFMISRAGHLMVMNRASEINAILEEVLTG